MALWLTCAIAFVLAYLLGSIPFGLLLTRAAGLGDIRQIGSGNIGATNVLRTGRKDVALATLVLDGGKGAGAVLLARWLGGHEAALLAGLGAVIGHQFSPWLGFKGGKGVATKLGTLLALNFWVGLATCGTWLVVAFLFRYSSLAALVSLALAPFYAWLIFDADRWTVLTIAALTLLVWQRHHENIGRLLRGEESKIGARKPAAPPSASPN